MKQRAVVLLVSLAGLMFGVLGLQASPPDEPISQAVKEVFLEGDPPGPIVGHLAGENGRSLAVRDNYVYAGFGDEFVVIDVTDKSMPVENGRLFIGERIRYIGLWGNYAYVLGDTDIHILDITDHNNIQYEGSYEDLDHIYGMRMRNNFVYISTVDTLYTLELSNNSSHLELRGELPLNILTIQDIDFYDNFIFILGDFPQKKILVIDISNPSQPNHVNSIDNVGGDRIEVINSHILRVDNACSQICFTYFDIFRLDSYWQARGLGTHSLPFSELSFSLEANSLYGFAGKDVGLYVYNYHLISEHQYVNPIAYFTIGDVRGIALQNEYVYAMSDEGLYILPAPPIYRTYMPFVPNN